MKLICLNTWGGQLKNELRDFIVKQTEDTDIFCLQEVFNRATSTREDLGHFDKNGYETLVKLLPDYNEYYAPVQTNEGGLAIFVKSNIKVDRVSELFVYRQFDSMVNDDSETLGRNIQAVSFNKDGQSYTVINFHGLWNVCGKTDTPDRLEQSRKIKEFIKAEAIGRVVLCGDFNLEPDTKSIAIVEKGMRNLIKENNIISTRSSYYKKSEKFADYVIVSKDLNVIRFEVLQDIVSDHLPLLLEFK